MTLTDMARELEKVDDALGWAIRHHTKDNEANAALHTNQKVYYSPLTTMLIEARGALEHVRRSVSAGRYMETGEGGWVDEATGLKSGGLVE